jgi:hypothetical protein
MRHQRRRRRATGLLALGLLAAAGAAGAAELIATGEPVRDTRTIASGYRPGPGLAQLSVVARDPEGGTAWGVRIYTAANRQRCVVAGQLNGISLGRVVGGTFRPYARDFAGSCDRPGRAFGATQYIAGRTLVFGLAAPGARRVVVTVDGRPQPARTGRGGAFLVVYRGAVTSDELKLDYGA